MLMQYDNTFDLYATLIQMLMHYDNTFDLYATLIQTNRHFHYFITNEITAQIHVHEYIIMKYT